MTEYTLVQFNQDFADEFDCQQYTICNMSIVETTALYNKALEIGKDGGVEYYFGTNEFFEPEYIEGLEYSTITKAEAEFLTDTLGNTFGTGILKQIIDVAECL